MGGRVGGVTREGGVMNLMLRTIKHRYKLNLSPHTQRPDDFNKRNLMNSANVHKYIPFISLPFSSPSGGKAERGRKELERKHRAGLLHVHGAQRRELSSGCAAVAG